MQKVRHYPRGLWLLIWVLIQVLFHQSSTYFSSFPLQYYSLSLNMLYLAKKKVLLSSAALNIRRSALALKIQTAYKPLYFIYY